MAHRILNLKEAAEYLHVTKARLEQLVKLKEIPHYIHSGNPVFRKSEIGEWASQRILSMPDDKLTKYQDDADADLKKKDPDSVESLSYLLHPNFCIAELPGKTRTSILHELVSAADKTGYVYNKSELFTTLNERENLASTGMPGGFAIPHPRFHDDWMFDQSFVIVAKAQQPVFWGAKDDGKTEIFFLICSKSDMHHLQVLARICVLCSKYNLVEKLRECETEEEMYQVIMEADKQYGAPKK